MTDLAPVRIQLVANGIEGVKSAFLSIEQSAKKLEESLNRVRAAGGTKRTSQTKREESEQTRIREQEAKKREAGQEREFAKLARQADKWRREEVAAEKRKNAQLEAEARKSAAARQRFFSNVGNKVVGGVGRTLHAGMALAGGVAALGGGFGIADAVGQSLANQKTARQIALQTYNSKTKGYDLSKEDVYSKGKALSVGTGFDTKTSLGAIHGFGETGGYENVAKMMPALKQIGDIAMATGADFEQLSKSAGLIFAGDTNQSADDLIKKLAMMAEMGRNGAVDLGDMAGSLNRITASAAQFSGDKMKNLTTMAALTQLARTKGTASSAEEATEATKSLSLDIAHNAKHFSALGINVKDPKTGELLDPRTTVMRSLAATGGDSEKLLKLYGHRSFKGVQGIQRIYQEERGKALKEGKSNEVASQRGLDAANRALDDFTEKTGDSARMTKEADEMRKDPSIQLTQALDKLKNEVGDKLVPELTKLIPKIAELAPKIVKLLDSVIKMGEWAAENPWKAMFAVLTALMVKEAGLALGAEFFKSLFTRAAVPGGGVGGPLGGVPMSGPAGGPGTAGAVLAGATIGVGTGLAVIDTTERTQEQGKKDLIKLQTDANNAMGKLGKDAKPEDVAKAVDTYNKLTKEIADQESIVGRYGKGLSRAGDFMEGKKGSEWTDLLNVVPLFGAFNATMGGKEFGGAEQQAKLAETQRDQLLKAIEEYKKNSENTSKNTQAMQNLTVAISTMNTTNQPPPPNTNGRPQTDGIH